jgi:hypothetical protein
MENYDEAKDGAAADKPSPSGSSSGGSSSSSGSDSDSDAEERKVGAPQVCRGARGLRRLAACQRQQSCLPRWPFASSDMSCTANAP